MRTGILAAEVFTEESPFTLDNTNPEKFRRVLTPPTQTDSLRPDFKGSSFTLPRLKPHKGPEKGGMVSDPSFNPNYARDLRRGIRNVVDSIRRNSIYGKLATR